MSRYLNPQKQAKEVWLMDNGFVVPNPYPPFYFKVTEEDRRHILRINDSILRQLEGIGADNGYDFYDKWCIVDLLNNGKFRAAAVYTSHDEVVESVNTFIGDPRQHIWFMVKKDLALAEVRDMQFIK